MKNQDLRHRGGGGRCLLKIPCAFIYYISVRVFVPHLIFQTLTALRIGMG